MNESCLLSNDLLLVKYTVASPYQRDADPDPIFTLGRIRIKLFFETVQDPDPTLH
jgi:hypothetical protein